ncbi:F-box only protein 10 isoform X2 [Caloenas nicobarica]|uniref:F-box only protein 10 isoform X2 n=1 Tax=Caloenas nicobarica TaxID=187106 RepID=UPI0032B75BF3
MEPIDLPAELWRLILSHLRLPELGRCSAVCRAWRQLVLSLDRTRWRQLCLGVLQHRPPSWPNRPAAEPPSWRDACKQHYLASKTWTRNMQDPESSTCLSLFRRRKGRRRLCVGTGGDFSSLRAALAAAGPYDRLVLLPGVHEEQSEVLLKMPVELVGQGGLGDVVLRARVDQHGPTARLCNLVLLPPHSSSLLYKVIMLRNDIHHCKASGIFLRLSAGGLIADNSIHSNGEAGVDIRKGANPLVLCNKIHSGLRSGIVVVGNGKGIIRSNQIYGNKEAGIYILYNGNPAVSGNHIFQGLAAGIAVNKNRRGHITGNVICENQWGGVDIRHGGNPILRSNLISCGYSDGVVVGERGKGLIEGNAIYGNKGCGVWMMSSSLPHLINNQISHNSIYGVAVFCCKDNAGDYPPGQGGIESFQEDREGSGVENDPDSEEEHPAAQCPISVALVELNSISHNGAAGLHVKSSEALNIFANMIHANSDGGVSVLQSSQLTCIANNSISCNSRAGVLVEAECQVELRGNGVYENGSHGIVSKGEGIITENDIIDNHQCGLQLLQAAHMKVTKNRIQSFRDYGIALFDEAKGLVQENLIFQGRSKKSILRPISNAEDCVIQNNVLLSFKKRFDTECMLTSPSARPHIEGGALGSCTVAGGQRVSSVSTRVDEGCHKHGSVFCTVL